MNPTILETLNSWAQSIVASGWSHFLQIALLAALLAVVDLTIGRRLGPRWRCALWLLFFVKLALPPQLSLPSSPAYWWPIRSQDATTPVPIAKPDPSPGIEMPARDRAWIEGPPAEWESGVAAAPARPATASWQLVVCGLWLTGALASALASAIGYGRLRARLARGTDAPETLVRALDDARRRVGVRRAVGLRLTAEDVSPMVTGIARPVIHLPRKVVARLDADQLHAVLVHELHHVKSRDTWVALTQTIARILFFHHPAVWFVNAHLSRLREVATDRAVLSHPEIGRKAYCAALVETAAVMSGVRRFPRLALGVVETKSQLENRIAMNLHHPRLARAHLGLPALASVAVLALVLLPMAPGRIAGSDETRAAPMGFEPAGDATTITRVDATIASIVGAFNRRDREAYLAAFTEDAILLPNGAPHTSGLAGVAQMYLQAPAGLVYEPFSETNRAVYEIGDWVIETGLIGFQFRLMPEAPVMTDPRQYLTIWQRSGAGDALAVKLLAWNQLMDTTALTRDVPAVTFRARAPGGAFRKDGDFAAVRAAEMLFHEHFESGAAQGSVDLYADDALLIPLEALPIRGRDAIRAYIEQLPAEKQVKRIERQLVHTEGNGNYVLVVNLFRWTFEPVAGVPIPVAGKGVHIWERSPDGKWRVLFDLPNVSQQSR